MQTSSPYASNSKSKAHNNTYKANQTEIMELVQAILTYEQIKSKNFWAYGWNLIYI